MRYFLIVLLLLACLFNHASAQAFLNEAATRGLLATSGSGVTFGGGISAYDFSGDGWDDITVATEAGQPILFFQNDGQGSFQQVTFPGISDSFQTKQLLWLDFDKNGWPDLFASSSKGQNVLYFNDGTYNFNRVVFPKSTIYPDTTIASYGAVAGDFDNDSYLDLFITHYDNRPGVPNQLFMYTGIQSYTEVTSGQVFNSYYQRTFCTSLTDYNRDFEADIYNAEDRQTINRLYEGDGYGNFSDVSATSGSDVVVNAMGIAIGDYDNDLDLDMYVSNTPEGNPMLRNNGDNTFTRVDSLINVSYNRVGWGVNFIDYDNDTDLDLYVSGTTDSFRVQSQLFINAGNGMFQPCPGDSLPGDSTLSFANAVGDFNNDGYPDIVVNNKGPDSLMLWMNQRSGNNWLKIKLRGNLNCNLDGVGTTVEVYAGGQAMVRYAGSAIGFNSQNSGTLFFGLGQATQVDSIWVHWPRNTDFFDQNAVSINDVMTIIEGQTLLGSNSGIEAQMTVWPQPATNFLRGRLPLATLSDWQIGLFDLQGRQVSQVKLPAGENDFLIPVADLSGGMYILRASGGAGLLSQKVLIAH